ncbi:MAG: hypothetical protein PHW13_10450 [Methylococcales bacterium]|nr:hypothetical protein [Methylococcales bacterium]
MLIRCFERPTDVFRILDGDAAGFHDARITAEEQARAEMMRNENHPEATLEDIYRYLPEAYSHITIDREIEAEILCLELRNTVFDIYQYALNNGKKVYAISDIYYSSTQLSFILNEKGMTFMGVYTSADAKGGKYGGKLFQQFMRDVDVSPDRILHIGDNRLSDYSSALKLGLQAIHLPKNHELLGRDSAFNLNAIHKLQSDHGAFSGFLISRIAKLKEERKLDSAARLFGAMYAAPLVCGFVMWLEQQARRDGMEELLLMARDGYIIKDVFAVLYPERKVTVFLCSRRSLLFPALKVHDEWMGQLFANAGNSSLRHILNGLVIDNMEEIIALLRDNGLEVDRHASATMIAKAVALLTEHKHLLAAQIDREYAACLDYCRQSGVVAAKTAVVDVGWGLSSQKALEQILRQPLNGYYIGANKEGNMHKKIKTFLFVPHDLRKRMAYFNNCMEIFELPFISDREQLISISHAEADKLEFVFRSVNSHERVRGYLANELHEAVLDFAESIKPFIGLFSVNDIRRAIINLYAALINEPAPTERLALGEIPHSRFVNGVEHLDLGGYWKSSLGGHELIQKVMMTVKKKGLKQTTLRAMDYFNEKYNMR